MNSITLKPIDTIDGEINLPGSKSLSNRALLLAALAEGTTTITNLLESADTKHMLNALKLLGVSYTLSEDKTECVVRGNGGAFEHTQEIELFLGNAGTAMRPLTAVLCLGKGTYHLTGEPRMEERPIGHLVDALREAGQILPIKKMKSFRLLRLRQLDFMVVKSRLMARFQANFSPLF